MLKPQQNAKVYKQGTHMDLREEREEGQYR